MKRTHKEIRKTILGALKDDKEHSYGSLERKANTNWQTIRDHCKDLELFGAVTISEEDQVKITKQGLEVLRKMKTE